MTLYSLIEELLHEVGKLALLEGEEWRIEHPELMDAYQALIDKIKTKEIEWKPLNPEI